MVQVTPVDFVIDVAVDKFLQTVIVVANWCELVEIVFNLEKLGSLLRHFLIDALIDLL
jgi:hypothetical protein